MTDQPNEEVARMHQAVGECVLAWATVEVYLQFLWRLAHNNDALLPDAIWGAVVSMDARLSALQKILKLKFGETEHWGDVVLLLEEARRRNSQRNEIAHATLLLEGGVTPRLESFFLISEPRTPISVEQIQERSRAFINLAQAISWLHHWRLEPAPMPRKQLQAFVQQPPDLILALRAERDRKSKEQSERQKLLRHALKLAEAGRLPDWPAD